MAYTDPGVERMSQYDDDVLSPTDLRMAGLKRLYRRVNRGLLDSYDRGHALASNYYANTSEGETFLGGFNVYELGLVQNILIERGYTIEPFTGTTPWMNPTPKDMIIFKVTWPRVPEVA